MNIAFAKTLVRALVLALVAGVAARAAIHLVIEHARANAAERRPRGRCTVPCDERGSVYGGAYVCGWTGD